MNILMLNPVHPGTPHISAVRAWRFAQELAALGHHVVLLTATDATRTINLSPDAHHDWRQPAVLPCADATSSSDQKPSHRIPRAMHRARTALRMLSHGGASTQWVRAAVDAGTHLPSDCAPDVVWATFGRMEALFAARHIAGRLHIPWVLDIKDNWELYTPRGLRQIMVWRTRGFAAATANAMFTQQLARKWQRAEASLVYSGVEDFFFCTDLHATL